MATEYVEALEATPTRPDFWREVSLLIGDKRWLQYCSERDYMVPTSQNMLADLCAATRLGCIPGFVGSAAWARHCIYFNIAVPQFLP